MILYKCQKVHHYMFKKECQLLSFEPGRKVRYISRAGTKLRYIQRIYRKPVGGGCAKCANQRRGNMNNYETDRKFLKRVVSHFPTRI